MHISLFTNIAKSQISESDTHFNIERVPVTVDGAVMNNIHYPADHNEKGMDSIKDRVVTLSHPTNSKGDGADAYAGESLQKFFSGGYITDKYRNNGVWYVNISIDKDILRVQDAKHDSNFYDRLANKEDIGVSTGLYTEIDNVPGTNAAGEEYKGSATNQVYNHLAMLDSSEPPAGGDSTFMRFNSADEQNLLINLADYMPDSIPGDDKEVEVEIEQPDDDKFFSKLMAFFATMGLIKGNDDNTTNQSEDDPMDIKNMVAELKKANMYKDNMSDDEVKAAFGKMKKGEDSEPKGNSDELVAAINALTAKVDSLQSKLDAQEQSVKDELVNKLKGLDIGITENGLKALPVEDLQAMANKADSQTISINGAFHKASQPTEFTYDDVPE